MGLYAANFDQLVAIAQRVVRDQSLAEDCVQDAFLAFHQKGVSPEPGRELAYLRTMVRNGAVSTVRSQVRQRETASRISQPQPSCSAETEALSLLAAEEIESAIERLAPKQAVVMELNLAGASVAETASALDITDGTVKTHRHRAAAAMRGNLELFVAA